MRDSEQRKALARKKRGGGGGEQRESYRQNTVDVG